MARPFAWILTTSWKVRSFFAALLMLDAQWFPRSEVARLVQRPDSGNLSRAENKQLEVAQQNKSTTSAVEANNALAPSERKEGEGNTGGSGKGLTRVPPATAIAGQLIRAWAAGELDLVSRL